MWEKFPTILPISKGLKKELKKFFGKLKNFLFLNEKKIRVKLFLITQEEEEKERYSLTNWS